VAVHATDLASLDAVDRSLLRALQDDCKRSLAELGAEVDLSPPAVLERVRKLEDAGIVTGYHATLEPRKLGLDIGAFIGVGIDHPRSIEKFEAAILALPEVLESHHVTGRHTLLLKIRTANTESLHKLISAIRALPGVARTETMIVLATQHERQRIPIDEPKPELRSRAARRSR
jgi:Lrp/AsnC family transcriptional regulator, leucine-responsive regulatory protein